MPTPEASSFGACFNLPRGGCARWTPARKAEVAAAILHRRLTMDTALRMYEVSEEELGSWLLAYERFGRLGLYATRRPPGP